LIYEGVDEAQRSRDRDTVKRWAEAAGTDLENEAQRAKQKLRNVDRVRQEINDRGGLGRGSPPLTRPGPYLVLVQSLALKCLVLRFS